MFSKVSSRTLTTFLEHSSIPLTLTSPVFDDCPVVLCNEAFLRLTGYARDEVIGRNCRFLQGRNTDPQARARLRTAIQEKQETLVPIVNYRKDGREFENYVFILPIFDANQNLLYMLGSQCDITTSLRTLTPLEHAQLLEDGIELTNPELMSEDHIRIVKRRKLAEAMKTVLTGEMFD
ncbi:MAG: PAS domain-containing protein [Hyphomicrobiaceae bacterium]|nr:PAS domain-containing protein [Hyphomicrobiaceae bacterium]